MDRQPICSSTEQNSFSKEFYIPNSAINFKVLNLEPNRTRLFEEAVKAQITLCTNCFPPFATLHYAASSKFVYVNKIPVDLFVSQTADLYKKFVEIREDCLDRHSTGDICFICPRRYSGRVSAAIQRHNGSNWRPPIRFTSTFGYLISDQILVWDKCPVKCVKSTSQRTAEWWNSITAS